MLDLPVVICIGTTKVSGDSLGPRVGALLKRKFRIDAFIYGDEVRSVTAVNYRDYCGFVRKKHKKSMIIAVDACLGSEDDIGKIKLTTEGVLAGGALDKGLERIGDLGVLGIVGRAGGNNLKTLLGVTEEFVEKLALQIALKIVAMLERSKFYGCI